MKASQPELVHARLIEALHYDPAAGLFTWKVQTSNQKIGTVAGTVKTKRGWRNIYLDGRSYRAGRLAWFYVHGEWPTRQIDHKNLNKSDDRLENLRLADQQQQSANRTRFKGKSLPKGVSLKMKVTPRYMARIRVNGELIYLGMFGTPDAASAAYGRAAAQYFGEFSRAT